MKTQTAFSIVELMVTVTVVSILMIMAFPSMELLLLNNRITAKTTEFIRALNYARTQAITLGTTIRIVKISQLAGKEVVGWTAGWRVCQGNCATQILGEARFEDNILFKPATAELEFIRFNGRGRVPEAQSEPIQFTICSPDYPRAEGRLVTISPIGIVRVESVEGKNLTCSAG